MTIIVQKFGGTSLGSIERIKRVATIISNGKQHGDDLVVVVSAMAGETNRLIQLAKALSTQPNTREFANLVTTGESVAMSLLTLALIERDHNACSFSGSQLPILTSDDHLNAEVLRVETKRIRTALAAGNIVVIGGYQGVSDVGDITTLGRGGSDLTAVVVAAALDAEECQIFTDVDGIYTADPRLVPLAHSYECLTYDQVLAISTYGAKVVQTQAVQAAKKHRVALRVLSSYQDRPTTGTLVTDAALKRSPELLASQDALVPLLSLAYQQKLTQLTWQGQDMTAVKSSVMSFLSKHHIANEGVSDVNLDSTEPACSILFTQDSYQMLLPLLPSLKVNPSSLKFTPTANLAKISVISLNAYDINDLADQVRVVLEKAEITPYQFSQAAHLVAFCVQEDALARSLSVLHTALGMDSDAPASGENLTFSSKQARI